jgi:dipeptide/tripeptide permease
MQGVSVEFEFAVDNLALPEDLELTRGCFATLRSFLFYPVYWLAYNQMTGNLTSQAAVMELNHVPNDIINNINPISLIVRFAFGTTRLPHRSRTGS